MFPISPKQQRYRKNAHRHLSSCRLATFGFLSRSPSAKFISASRFANTPARARSRNDWASPLEAWIRSGAGSCLACNFCCSSSCFCRNRGLVPLLFCFLVSLAFCGFQPLVVLLLRWSFLSLPARLRAYLLLLLLVFLVQLPLRTTVERTTLNGVSPPKYAYRRSRARFRWAVAWSAAAGRRGKAWSSRMS